MRILSKAQIEKLNMEGLAKKHGCSGVYVRKLLAGARPPSTKLSKAVVKDALILTAVLETPSDGNPSPFEIYEETLCVHGGWLYAEDGANVMTRGDYNSYVNRKVFWRLRRACPGHPSLIAWNSIPLKFQKAIIKKFGDPTQNQELHV